MTRRISRRTALAGAAGGFLQAASAPLQTRVLGRTGIRTTILGMGCGESWWKYCAEEQVARRTFELALESGIRYFDTGQTYGKGVSEAWVGNSLGGHRKEVTLATKISTRDADEALRETERSLKRLKTDYLDILHIHNLRNDDDLATIEKPGGLLEAMYRMRKERIARFIGITSHTNPITLKTALERHEFDCVQMALNAAMQGAYENSAGPGNSFERIALPVAKAKNLGILAMKATGRSELIGTEPTKANAQELIRYALSLPIAVAVIGLGNPEHVKANAELARTFKSMSEAEMTSLVQRVVGRRAALQGFFRHHEDA